jgi:hypothetical protein
VKKHHGNRFQMTAAPILALVDAVQTLSVRLLNNFKGDKKMSNEKIESAAPHGLPSLPYADNALASVISANTVGFHYGKHHKGYVNSLNKLVAGTEFADLSLEKIITKGF